MTYTSKQLKRSQRFVCTYLVCCVAAPVLLWSSRHFPHHCQPLATGVALALTLFAASTSALCIIAVLFVEHEFWTRLAGCLIASAGVLSTVAVAALALLGGGQ